MLANIYAFVTIKYWPLRNLTLTVKQMRSLYRLPATNALKSKA